MPGTAARPAKDRPVEGTQITERACRPAGRRSLPEQRLQLYLNVGSNYHCLKFLNFQRVTVNLSLSTDLLFKVATVTSYFSMNSEGRMSFIEQVKESVEKAAEEMREFNESVRSTVIYKSMKGHNRKTYYPGDGWPLSHDTPIKRYESR